MGRGFGGITPSWTMNKATRMRCRGRRFGFCSARSSTAETCSDHTKVYQKLALLCFLKRHVDNGAIESVLRLSSNSGTCIQTNWPCSSRILSLIIKIASRIHNGTLT